MGKKSDKAAGLLKVMLDTIGEEIKIFKSLISTKVFKKHMQKGKEKIKECFRKSKKVLKS